MTPVPLPVDRPARTGRRVLVIDDYRDAAESLVVLLNLVGYRAEAAFDGPSGIEAARRSRPDVVLVDIAMPGGMTGYEVAGILRAELPGALLVALTGYGRDEDLKHAAAAGFDHHLVKPADPDALCRLLAEN